MAPKCGPEYKPFLNLFLVWHPTFIAQEQDGEAIGETLYREFCRDSDKPMSPAIGVPIYFRTSSKAGSAPQPIDTAGAHHTVVVFLTNAKMVLDPAYRQYVETLGKA